MAGKVFHPAAQEQVHFFFQAHMPRRVGNSSSSSRMATSCSNVHRVGPTDNAKWRRNGRRKKRNDIVCTGCRWRGPLRLYAQPRFHPICTHDAREPTVGMRVPARPDGNSQCIVPPPANTYAARV